MTDDPLIDRTISPLPRGGEAGRRWLLIAAKQEYAALK